MKYEIDVEEFAKALKEGKWISGKDGALTPLIKQLTELALQAELESRECSKITYEKLTTLTPPLRIILAFFTFVSILAKILDIFVGFMGRVFYQS